MKNHSVTGYLARGALLDGLRQHLQRKGHDDDYRMSGVHRQVPAPIAYALRR